jgi:hypothetical protein
MSNEAHFVKAASLSSLLSKMMEAAF